jgi:hypothetical protein
LADVDCIGVGQRVHREAVRQQDRLGTAKSFNGRFERTAIECRLGPEWNDQAKKLNKDDWVNMQGRISNNQKGSQLYLLDCEFTSDAR